MASGRTSTGAAADWVRAHPGAALLAVAVVVLAVLAVLLGSEILVPLAVLAVLVLAIAGAQRERHRRGTAARAEAPARVETAAPDLDPGGTAPGRALTERPPE